MTTTTFPRALSLRVRPILGLASAAAGAVALYLALVWAPPDAVQGDVQRVMYVHVPAAWLAYLAFLVVFLASIAWLWSRSAVADAVAVASAEIGVMFTGLAIVLGSIWAKPTWGVWWTWEPRLITTAIMFAMYVGYLLLRSLEADPERRATRAAVVGIVAVVNVPIVHLSVTWMNALHQLPTVLRPGPPAIDARMLTTLIVCVIAGTVLYAYLMAERVRLELGRGTAA
ncbi:MAG TPA: cytochrome c biogenesis protein CcsA [Candidatus Limnocylindria bacterium]|nr:cytochrome c biogenesis protein CcsA [Candidatus Limnocylindria bacterium]